jgi:DNA-binding response OmpR family regulator
MQATILVIDDDVGILDAMEALLDDEGYRVLPFLQPQPALDLLTPGSAQPDLIVLDVLLSGSDGRDICHALKSDPRTQHIPIIMTSAHPGAQASVAACGADDFIPKPFDIDDLLAKVQARLAAAATTPEQHT